MNNFYDMLKVLNDKIDKIKSRDICPMILDSIDFLMENEEELSCILLVHIDAMLTDLLKKVENNKFRKKTEKCKDCVSRKSYSMKRQLCSHNLDVFEMANNSECN